MASVVDYGIKQFRAFAFDLDGKRMSKIFSSKSKAYAWGENVENGTVSTTRKPAPRSFEGLLTAYIASLPSSDVADSTAKTYSEITKGLINRLPASLLSAASDSVTAEQIANYLFTRNASNNTKRLELAVISNAFDFSRRQDRTRQNPTSQVDRPAPSKPRERRLLTVTNCGLDEEAMLFAELAKQPNNQVTLVVRLALATGMRLNEILSIRKFQVDHDLKLVHLPKTKNGEQRFVPISPEVHHHLKAYLSTIKWQHPMDRLFTITDKSFQTLFRRIHERVIASAKSQGVLLPPFSIHCARHEATSRFLENASRLNWDLPKIMSITGHKDPRMVTQRYGHIVNRSNAADMYDDLQLVYGEPRLA